MKKSILLKTLILILLFGVTARAQNDDDLISQLNTLADQLKQTTNELASRTYNDIKPGSSNNRRQIKRAFAAREFDAGAGLFQQMLVDNRSLAELEEAVKALKDLAGRGPNGDAYRELWRNAKDTVENIERTLKNRDKNAGKDKDPDKTGSGNNGQGSILGRALWRGMVDKKVHLLVKESQIQTRTMEGSSYPDGQFTFIAALPRTEVTVGVNKKDGRGKVRVFQQPTSENDFTAIIEIEDSGGGAKEYRVEIFWK